MPRPASILRVSRIASLVGLVLILVGAVTGFSRMFLTGNSDSVGLLSLIPIGFVVLFLSFSAQIMFEPRSGQAGGEHRPLDDDQ